MPSKSIVEPNIRFDNIPGDSIVPDVSHGYDIIVCYDTSIRSPKEFILIIAGVWRRAAGCNA